jgi:hypothetical protein
MTAASRLLADDKVKSRVAELRTSFREVLEQQLGVKQETMARYLLGIIETPVGEVDENSSLAQEVKKSRKFVGKGEEAQEWEVEQIKTPSKLDAINTLNKMAGWYEPERVEIGVTGLEALAKRLRK